MSAPKPAPNPAPKPAARAGPASLWRHLRLSRRDLLSAQPARLYRAWMAELRTPFFHSFVVNDPRLVRRVLDQRPGEFPKSDRAAAGLRPLLGDSLFLANGARWERQRRIVEAAFAGGRVKDAFPAMWAAGEAGVARLAPLADGQPVELEQHASHAAADVILRTLFSLPIEDRSAAEVFAAFQAHQRAQPVLTLAALVPRFRWAGRLVPRRARRAAGAIRALVGGLTRARAAALAAGAAPDDLATRLMTARDPLTGEGLGPEEVADEVATFFLAGHETSAAALAWTIWLLAANPEWQDRAAAEAVAMGPDFAGLSRLRVCRDALREALRLYPPVPMMVREAACPQVFRGRTVPRGAQVVVSPWHLHRHERIWPDPDAFDPGRWATNEGRACARDAYLPFSRGPRACLGAGFAMAEGVVILALWLRRFRFEVVEGREPVPVAHLTVRARDGIWVRLVPRPSAPGLLPPDDPAAQGAAGG